MGAQAEFFNGISQINFNCEYTQGQAVPRKHAVRG